MRIFIIIFSTLILFSSCKDSSQKSSLSDIEINIEKGHADSKSEIWANRILSAMGGEEKWENTNYLSWTFFGSRKLLWDKKNSRVRIENPRDTSLYLVDLQTLKGKYYKNGIEVTDTTIVNSKMNQAKSIWINDSYWLVMPFKLRDKGVILKYLREDTITSNVSATVLELTFDNVGNTPNNKYEVYIDHTDNLIKKWSFFKSADQSSPPRSWPWDNYQDFNGLLLSTDRSDKSGLSEVKAYQTIDNSLFERL